MNIVRSIYVVLLVLLSPALLFSQKNLYQIKNNSEVDSQIKSWGCDSIERYLTQNEVLPISDFKKLIPQLTNQSAFKANNKIFLRPLHIRPDITSLLFLSKTAPDTTCLQDDEYALDIYNFNKECNLISTCHISVYEEINSGLSFGSLITYLTFSDNYIFIKEIRIDRPTDMIIHFKVTEETFKSKIEHSIFMDPAGNMILKK